MARDQDLKEAYVFSMNSDDEATVLLVHGAWHSSKNWSQITPLLDAAGSWHTLGARAVSSS
jgi:hypothetical protein